MLLKSGWIKHLLLSKQAWLQIRVGSLSVGNKATGQ